MKEKKIIIGLWQLSKGHGEEGYDYKKLLEQYIKKGYTTFDCADIYEGTEELLGSFTGEEDIIVNTKHVPDLEKILDGTITQEYLQKLLLESMKKLQVSCIDNVQFHWWDYKKNGYGMCLENMISLQEKGKINKIGVTNTNVDFLNEYIDNYKFTPYSTQNQYSIIDRRVEKGLLGFITQNNIKLFCYGSLMGGLLTDRYLGKNRPQEPLENRSLRKYLLVIDDWSSWDTFQELLRVMKKIGDKYRVDIASVALAWILGREGVSSVILGIRRKGIKQEYKKLSDTFLSKSDYSEIDKVYLIGRPLEGDVFDLERYADRHKNIMKFNLNK